MRRFMKGLSTTVALGIVASVFTVSPALAAQDVRYEIYYSYNGYFTITNVVDMEHNTAPVLYKAVVPVTVTFYGDDLTLETITRTEPELQGDEVYFQPSEESVQFAVKNFTYYGETEVHDELTEGRTTRVFVYVAGNYAVLTEPGYYLVQVSPQGVPPTKAVIQVVDKADQEPDTAEAVSAIPTPSTVLVNGKEVAFEAYNIDGYNYFKLRDLAMALNGTQKQFEVTWDGEKNAISLGYRQPYTPVGGELTVPTDTAVQQAVPTASRLLSNGMVPLVMKSYNIGGYNYFKLRDIAELYDFGVTWDASAGTIVIDTASPYSE